MKFYIVIIFISIIAISCKTDFDVNCSDVDSLSFKLEKELLFPLDSMTAISSNIVRLHLENNKGFLILSDFDNWKIKVYEMNSKNLVKSISFSKEGPNGVGQLPSGFHYFSKDSILLFFNSSQRITLINENGEILDKTGSLSNPNEHIPLLDVTPEMDVFSRGSKIYFQTYGLTSTKKAGAIVDLKTREVTYPFELPEIFSTGWWSGVVHPNYYGVYNSKDHLIVQSFGNDNLIYTIDDNGGKNQYCAKSKYIQKIRPFSEDRKNADKYAQEIYRHEALQGSYGTIYFDRYRELYYRVVCHPVKAEEFHNPNQIWEQVSLIILNKNFKKIGEFDLPVEYSFTKLFISNEGLCLFNKLAYQKNDNIMNFGVFTIKPL